MTLYLHLISVTRLERLQSELRNTVTPYFLCAPYIKTFKNFWTFGVKDFTELRNPGSTGRFCYKNLPIPPELHNSPTAEIQSFVKQKLRIFEFGELRITKSGSSDLHILNRGGFGISYQAGGIFESYKMYLRNL